MSVLTCSYTDPAGKEYITTHESMSNIDLSIVVKDSNSKHQEHVEDVNVITEESENVTDYLDESHENCHLDGADTEIEILVPQDIMEDVKTTTKLAASPSVNSTIKYAPAVAPVKGNYNLYCIALVWNDNSGPDFKKLTASGENTAQIYKKLSNGNFNLNLIVKSIKVDFNHNAKNIPAAEAQAKKIAVVDQKNKNPNLFIIVNNGARKFSNGSGNTAHLFGTLTRDFLHELGHCKPLLLEHSGRIMPDGTFASYSDGTSFMSKLNSLQLTAVQLYTLGWLPENKVALHEFGFPPVEYKISKLSAPNTGDSVKAVMIPVEGQKPLFLSMPKVDGNDMFALHQPYGDKGAVGTGSKRLLVFSNAATYVNLSFQKVSETKDYTVVRIEPVKPPKP